MGFKWALCVLILFQSTAALGLLDITKIEQEIAKVTDLMGTYQIQRKYDTMEWDDNTLVGKEILQNLLGLWRSYIIKMKHTVNQIVEQAQQETGNPPNFSKKRTLKKCCLADGSYDFKFNKTVDKTTGCIYSSKAVENDQDTLYPQQKIADVMIQNSNDIPNLHWQHFTTEGGVTLVYPQMNMSDEDTGICPDFDPRYNFEFEQAWHNTFEQKLKLTDVIVGYPRAFSSLLVISKDGEITCSYPTMTCREFYRSGATIPAKDVVIVLDSTSHMYNEYINSDTRISIAKAVASNIIKTLNPNDRVAAIAYGADVKTYKSCSNHNLLFNINGDYKELVYFMNDLVALNGQPDTEKAFIKAFEFLRNSYKKDSNPDREKVIVFIGDNTSLTGNENLLSVIRDENARMNNSVVINAMGIMSQGANVQYLRDMANQVQANEANGVVRQGMVIVFSDQKSIRNKLTDWLGSFRTRDSQIFSIPYLDTFTKRGLVLAVCGPAYDSQNKLLGVACAETRLIDLFKESAEFQESHLSYMFVIDSYGRTLRHPLLQLPRTIRQDVPIRDIHSLERNKNLESLLKDMKKRNKNDGVIIANTDRILSRGVEALEGIEIVSIEETQYFYAPVEDTDYTVALVLCGNPMKSNMIADAGLVDSEIQECFQFHEHKKYNPYPNQQWCSHYERNATKEKSLMQFNARAFESPEKLLYTNFTQVDIQKMSDYFCLNGQPNTENFRKGVREAVRASYEFEKFWKSTIDGQTRLVWRYFASTNGFIRMLPGAELARGYDHETRPWYNRALSESDRTCITPPYIDAWGSGWLISFFQTVKKKTGEIEGVSGTDTPVPYLYNKMLKLYPDCNNWRCMLVDNRGFIIIHRGFFGRKEKESYSYISNSHIVSLESNLARSLISEGIMEKKKSTNFDTKKIQITYSLKIADESSQIFGENGIYEIYPLRNTNIFMIVIKGEPSNIDQCCLKEFRDPTLEVCSNKESACSCLCYEKLDICEYESSEESIKRYSTLPPTSPSATPDYYGKILDNVQGERPKCFDNHCSAQGSQQSCYDKIGCNWCSKYGDAILYKSCCQIQTVCPWEVIPTVGDQCTNIGDCRCNPPNNNPYNPSSPSEGQGPNVNNGPVVAVGVSLGVIILILLIILVLVIIFFVRKKSQTDDTYLSAIDIVDPYSLSNDVTNSAMDGGYESSCGSMHIPNKTAKVGLDLQNLAYKTQITD